MDNSLIERISNNLRERNRAKSSITRDGSMKEETWPQGAQIKNPSWELFYQCRCEWWQKVSELSKKIEIIWKQGRCVVGSGEYRLARNCRMCLFNASSSYLCVCSSVRLFCDPIDGIPPDPSVHRIFQARIWEGVAISSSRRSSQPRDQTHISWVSCIGRSKDY